MQFHWEEILSKADKIQEPIRIDMMYLQEEGQVNVQGWFKMGGRITEE